MELKSVINFYKQHGFLKVLKRFLEKIGFRFFKRSVFLIKLDLNSVPIDLEVPHPVVIATKEDIQKDRDYYDSWFTKEEALARLEKGCLLFVIKENNKMVSSEWVEFKKVKITFLDLLFHIPEDVAYMTGRYTDPAFRGKGLATKVDKGIFQYLRKQGYNYTLGITDATNNAALGLNRKTGWEAYQLVNYRRYWFIKYFCVKKCNSDDYKIFITLFRAPEKMWKVFL